MKRLVSCLSFVLLVGFIFAIAAGGAIFFVRYMPSGEKADRSEVFAAEGPDGAALYLNYERQQEDASFVDGQWYLTLSFVKANLNNRFYFDEEEKLLLYALPEEVEKLTEAAVDDSGRPAFRVNDGTVRISLEVVQRHTDIRAEGFSEDGYPRLYISNSRDAFTEAAVRKKTQVRLRGGVKSPILTEAAAEDSVVVLDSMERWARVYTPDGCIGYLPVKHITDLHSVEPESFFEEPVYSHIRMDEKITMVWHQTTSQAANQAMGSMLAGRSGVNVIAPTWFALKDNEGNYESLASRSYVEEAHGRGIQVWAVLDNFGHDFSDNVNAGVLLAKTSVREKLVEALVAEAKEVGIDGLNVDLEGLNASAGDHYIEFIRELSVACRKYGLVLSVDNYVPESYNRFYQFAEQGAVADYVVIMAYDEHYAGSEPGSVSSRGYVERAITEMEKMVPPEAIICGVPFFTRIWKVGTDSSDSSAMSIGSAKQWLSEQEFALAWDETTGQYYGEHGIPNYLYMVWMEEERSLGVKMDLIRQHDLAGVACWKLGQETDEAWSAISWEKEQ